MNKSYKSRCPECTGTGKSGDIYKNVVDLHALKPCKLCNGRGWIENLMNNRGWTNDLIRLLADRLYQRKVFRPVLVNSREWKSMHINPYLELP